VETPHPTERCGVCEEGEAAKEVRLKMRLLLLLLAIIPAVALAQNAPSLASLKDKNRVLLVFAPSTQDADFEQHFVILHRYAAGMKERDLVAIPVVVDAGEANGPNTLRNLHPPIASDMDQIDLRHRFHVPTGEFAVILIGKDGGEKLRQTSPITAAQLSAVIDAMPGRQGEMRERNQQ
jgi:hypothetical protein